MRETPQPASVHRMNPRMPPRQTLSIGYFVLVAAVLFAVQSFFAPKVTELSYSDFKKRLGEGRLQDVVISDSLIRGKLSPEKGEPVTFVTVRVADDTLVPDLEKNNVKFEGQYESPFLNSLVSWPSLPSNSSNG